MGTSLRLQEYKYLLDFVQWFTATLKLHFHVLPPALPTTRCYRGWRIYNRAAVQTPTPTHIPRSAGAEWTCSEAGRLEKTQDCRGNLDSRAKQTTVTAASGQHNGTRLSFLLCTVGIRYFISNVVHLCWTLLYYWYSNSTITKGVSVWPTVHKW